MLSRSSLRARAPRSAPLRHRSDARCGVVGLLRAAAGERRDEALLGRRGRASCEPRHREVSEERRPPRETEALEVAPLDLLGDGVAREEREPEAFAAGAFDRLARPELPHTRRPDADCVQLLVNYLLRARAAL